MYFIAGGDARKEVVVVVADAYDTLEMSKKMRMVMEVIEDGHEGRGVEELVDDGVSVEKRRNTHVVLVGRPPGGG